VAFVVLIFTVHLAKVSGTRFSWIHKKSSANGNTQLRCTVVH